MDETEQDDAVVRLWDELADFEAGRIEDARSHLMNRLRSMVRGKNVVWVGATRTADDPADPLRGWRIAATAYLIDLPLDAIAVREFKDRWSRREIDPLNIRSVEGAGQRFRVFSLHSAMPPEWFAQPFYRIFYADRDVHDCIIAAFPVNRDAESLFVIHGTVARGPFDAADLALVSRTLRGIKWFHRRLMLEQGLHVASSPLTPAERRTLAELLTEATEKEIAARLELTVNTVHQYAKAIYRKFGVKGRTSLMSLWLNQF